MPPKSSEKGQALIIIALAVIVLFGFAALAIDGSILFSDRRHAQNAADTAALAAGLANTRGNPYEKAALDRAKTNGYDNNGGSNLVEISAVNTNMECPETGKFITVKITSHIKTTFARVLGWTQLTNVVNATVIACDFAKGKPLYDGSSVWSTNTGSCNGFDGANIGVNGAGHVELFGGGFGSSSTDPNCMIFAGTTELHYESPGGCPAIVTAQTTPPNLTSVNDSDKCITNAQGQKQATLGYRFKNPPADLNIECQGNASASGNTMTPGNWTGNFPPRGISQLNPGTYCITDGDFTMQGGTLKGTGVTIVLKNGTVKLTGQAETKLTAPTSDPYKGLLIYAPPSNSIYNQPTRNNNIAIDGSGNSSWTGTILAQNLPCNFGGNNQIQKQKLQFICLTWSEVGSGQAALQYDSSVFYSPDTAPSVSMFSGGY